MALHPSSHVVKTKKKRKTKKGPKPAKKTRHK